MTFQVFEPKDFDPTFLYRFKSFTVIITCQPSNKIVLKKFPTSMYISKTNTCDFCFNYMKVSCFQNFLQVCTFLSQTPVTFALIMWKYLASLIFVLILFFFFLEWRYNCITFWNWDTDGWLKKSEVKNDVSVVIKID